MSTKDQIKSKMSFLFDQHEFSFDDSKELFDGMIFVIRNKYIALKLVFDRADFFVDVSKASEPENWMPLFKLLKELRQKGVISSDIAAKNKLGYQASLLREHYSNIKNYF